MKRLPPFNVQNEPDPVLISENMLVLVLETPPPPGQQLTAAPLWPLRIGVPLLGWDYGGGRGGGGVHIQQDRGYQSDQVMGFLI